MEISSKIMLFQETFKGRIDVVPRYWKSKSGKQGYSPVCSNEWKDGICKKPCSTCKNAVYIPLSVTLTLDHFKGKHILGVYPLLKDNSCFFIACDFDNHTGDRDPRQDVMSFYETCQVHEMPCYVLRSKSGKGYHSYIFFDTPVHAWKARVVVFFLLGEAGVIGDDIEISSFDRLFPNQDELTGKGFGNLIALPFQGMAAKKENTLFLDPSTEFEKSFENQMEVLKTIERVSESKLDEIIEQWGLERGDTQSRQLGNGNPPGWIVEALAGVETGARDVTGTKLAGYFTRKHVPLDVISAILHLWNKCNKPPLEPHEIDKITQSVGRYHQIGDPQNDDHRIRVSFIESQGSN